MDPSLPLDLAALAGMQPKKNIVRYLAEQGISTPKIFDCLDEAIASGKDILVRSEHPHEFNRVSGLFSSLSLDHSSLANSKTDQSLQQAFVKRNEQEGYAAKSYSKFWSMSQEDLLKDLSYSLWEKLPGSNRCIVADSAIPYRYHIMASREDASFRYQSYALIEHGKEVFGNYHQSFRDWDQNIGLWYSQMIARHAPDLIPLTGYVFSALNWVFAKRQIRNPSWLLHEYHEMISLYERVRSLTDPNNCPVVEMQTVNGKHYVLQYHNGRDFQPAAFVLDRPPEEGEHEAVYVRGATPPEGLTCKTTIFHIAQINHDLSYPQVHEASFLHRGGIIAEQMARHTKVQFMGNLLFNKDGTPNMAYEITNSHYARSGLIFPEVALGIPMDRIISREEVSALIHRAHQPGQTEDTFITVHVISDGRKAYVKRVE
ncbi:hypothetical protein HZB02_06860 [Candidatus Woesearchaeota archaeon]|nr:hypothetical protein [Candidatus Woesearchaeota archaeon]